MPALPKLTGKEVAKVAVKLGFVHSHMVYKHPDGRVAVIPHHSGEEIGPGLLNKIIKRNFKISKDEFLKQL